MFISVSVVYVIFKQSGKLIFSNHNLQVEEIFFDRNTLKRYYNYIKNNILSLFESFIIIKIILFILFSSLIIDVSSGIFPPYSFQSITLINIFVFFAAVYVFILGADLFSGKIINKTAPALIFPIYWINVFVKPIWEVANEFIFLFDKKIFNGKLEQNHNNIVEYFWGEYKIDENHDDSEIELIDGIVSFKEISAKEVMTPRMDIVAISTETKFDEILDTINTSRHSRIPLYEGDLDNIIGIIYAKDLLPYLGDTEKKLSFEISGVARKALFIPETKMIKDLLTEFQEKKMHIAIVIDEFGSTAGLISLEDIIEEIVGEIRDELDIEENPIIKIDDSKFMILGKVSLEEINEIININLPVLESYDSIGGFILSNAAVFPKEGYSFQYENVTITVKEIINKQIKKVLLEKITG
jgi:Hemolysins and related proteins containing CBS domains